MDLILPTLLAAAIAVGLVKLLFAIRKRRNKMRERRRLESLFEDVVKPLRKKP